MNYYNYLQSDTWKQFRKEIITIRKQCQKCGVKSCLNLHHKNYACLGKEKNEDVIVLCKTCHFKFHNKNKWKKIKKLGGVMDFTRTNKPDNPLYRASDTNRLCVRCGEEHPVFYRIFKNGRKVLAMACPNSKPRVTFLPFEELLVPTINRKPGALDDSELK